MFSQFMLPGLLLAIGFAGAIWWALEAFTVLPSSKADGIAVVSGLAVSFTISLRNRGLMDEPLQVVLALLVIVLSYILMQIEQKRRDSRLSQSEAKYN